MNKYNETFGVDISKDVFDCFGSKSGHVQIIRMIKGIQEAIETITYQ